MDRHLESRARRGAVCQAAAGDACPLSRSGYSASDGLPANAPGSLRVTVLEPGSLPLKRKSSVEFRAAGFSRALVVADI